MIEPPVQAEEMAARWKILRKERSEFPTAPWKSMRPISTFPQPRLLPYINFSQKGDARLMIAPAAQMTEQHLSSAEVQDSTFPDD
jgi:hypothetical protein